MNAVAWPRSDALSERLLWIDPVRGDFGDKHVRDLVDLPRRGDLLVVNDAATLPASLQGATARGVPVEVRLAAQVGDAWTCLLFGAGDWRARTELRPSAPPLAPGDNLSFRSGDDELHAEVVELERTGRVASLRFNEQGARLWRALYRLGRPVQYSYVERPLSLFHVQTAYSSRPWAAEMPSAGRPLTWGLLLALRARGVGVARVTHAAGLSSTGDAALDGTLPWAERFDVPEETTRLVGMTRRSGGRVVAVGTSVVRALEGAAQATGKLVAGEGVTNLVIGPGFVPRVVDGLFTGLHEATASHFALLQAFASRDLLDRAYEHAERAGYEGHEFGDSCLILGR
jgi:S-adenosylmethionine:tRNA ribosyltransferase-isomerase